MDKFAFLLGDWDLDYQFPKSTFGEARRGFPDDETLFLNWHDSLLTQSFVNTGPDRVTLRMGHPGPRGEYELIMEVLMSRRNPA